MPTDPNRKVRKRCARCGWTGKALPRQRHCYQRKFGKGSYACWGDLAEVPREVRTFVPAVPTPDGLGLGWQLGAGAEAQRMEKFREEARKGLARARLRLDDAIADLDRATERLLRWRTEVKRLEKKAAMTDAEILAERDRRQAAVVKGKARRLRRGMAVV